MLQTFFASRFSSYTSFLRAFWKSHLNRIVQTTQQMFSRTRVQQSCIFRCLEKVESRGNLPTARLPAPHPCLCFRVTDTKPTVDLPAGWLSPPSGEGAPTERDVRKAPLSFIQQQMPDWQLDPINFSKPLICIEVQGSSMAKQLLLQRRPRTPVSSRGGGLRASPVSPSQHF